MKILVLSDSHYEDIILNTSYDYIIHCGDYGQSQKLLDLNKALYVRGNCDFNGQKEIIEVINNKKILITHGDLYNVKINYNRLVYKAVSEEVNICFYGHTHNQNYFYADDILFINPGAYLNGSYVEIINDEILFYENNTFIEKIVFRW